MVRLSQEHGPRALHPALGTDGPDGDAPDRPGKEAATGFIPVPEMIRQLSLAQPAAPAVICGDQQIDYGGLEAETRRIAGWLQATGHRHGDRVALLGASSISWVCAFLAVLRAGLVAVPLSPTATREALLAMVSDAGAKTVFADFDACVQMGMKARPGLGLGLLGDTVELDAGAAGGREPVFADGPFEIGPQAPFNIIYSSGTTGTPKGVVQPHVMRWSHVDRARPSDYGPGGVTLISTPLYSNTTLVSFFPTLALGGCVVLMPRFNPVRFLDLSTRHRVTHAMLVPVQYRRILDEPTFGDYDLGSFRQKLATSSPFPADLKRQVLARWPGGLTEYYGMTEGGGTCILKAHLHPDKLHTVGQPAPGHDIRLIDEDGREVAAGEAGEVVGRSVSMMLGYHNRLAQTREAEWIDPAGHRFIRTGDIGRFDADGFLVLLDRKKDMIISGGFNIYPSDLEQILHAHPAIAEAAVVGTPSERWGETPVAWVVLRAGSETPTAQALLDWLNGRVGKTQRLAGLTIVPTLPRSTIGKVLKRELREAWREPEAGNPASALATPPT